MIQYGNQPRLYNIFLLAGCHQPHERRRILHPTYRAGNATTYRDELVLQYYLPEALVRLPHWAFSIHVLVLHDVQAAHIVGKVRQIHELRIHTNAHRQLRVQRQRQKKIIRAAYTSSEYHRQAVDSRLFDRLFQNHHRRPPDYTRTKCVSRDPVTFSLLERRVRTRTFMRVEAGYSASKIALTQFCPSRGWVRVCTRTHRYALFEELGPVH